MGKRRTISSEYVKEVEEQGVLNVTHVIYSCLLEGCAVYDPSLAFLGDIRNRPEGAEGTLTNENLTKNRRP